MNNLKGLNSPLLLEIMETIIQKLEELGIRVKYDSREEGLKRMKELEEMNEEIRAAASFVRICGKNSRKIPATQYIQISNDRASAALKTNIWRRDTTG
jgi:hypothetical protein